MIGLKSNKLAIRWYDETILILKKLSENEKPSASFDCEKAFSPVEKTICRSIALAAFDLSVGQSYLSAGKRYKEQNNSVAINRLRSEQKTWLATRDKCGVDMECIQKAMANRLETLENEQLTQ